MRTFHGVDVVERTALTFMPQYTISEYRRSALDFVASPAGRVKVQLDGSACERPSRCMATKVVLEY
jgi:hypothetical protein